MLFFSKISTAQPFFSNCHAVTKPIGPAPIINALLSDFILLTSNYIIT